VSIATPTDPIDVDVVGAIVPFTARELITAAPTSAVVEVQRQYHELCLALLDSTDYQTIGGKKFRKKSGWRKLAVAFNVTCELIDRSYERDAGGRILRAECIVRAIAPNGRHMDGLGACDLHEKCCDAASCKKKTVWPDSGRPTGHVHCTDTCNGRAHFSNPSHDIPSTAMTRATNRACADLFGMGEVSAEEITDNGHGGWDEQSGGSPIDPEPVSVVPAAGEPGPVAAPAPRPAATAPSGPRPISAGQIGLIEAVSAKLNYDCAEDAVAFILGEARLPEHLTMAEARKVIDALKGMENGEAP